MMSVRMRFIYKIIHQQRHHAFYSGSGFLMSIGKLNFVDGSFSQCSLIACLIKYLMSILWSFRIIISVGDIISSFCVSECLMTAFIQRYTNYFRDRLFMELCFWQAVADVNSGLISAKEKMYQLKALQSIERADKVGIVFDFYFCVELKYHKGGTHR